MKRAFVVTLEVSSQDDLNQIAAVIKSELDPVFGEVQVNVWDSATTAATPSLPTFPSL